MLSETVEVADVSYAPESPDDGVLSSRQGLLLGETSQIEVRRFDVVAFSVSYENDFGHIPELLMTAGMAPLASDRDEAFPLVIAGGYTMASNPLPVADFMDAVVVGEAEPVIQALLEAVGRAGNTHMSKPGMLGLLAGLEGVYVPSLGERKVKRVWAATDDIARDTSPRAGSHFGEMFLVEVGRGCGRACLFCGAGSLYRPVRVRGRQTVLEGCGDFERIGLLGTAVGDHPDILTILEDLVGQGKTLGMSSLRADQINPRIADLLVAGGVRTIAIAPEAGSEELRERIGKGITRDQVFEAVTTLARAGIATIKLYFMIGLPGESDQDVEAIVSLVTGLAGVRGKARLDVAVGPFVPKPHTPFQWAAFADRKTLDRRVRMLREIPKVGGCALKVGSIDEAWVEAVLARGDRSLSDCLLEAARRKLPLKTVLKRSGAADPTLDLDTLKPLPWDFIDSGISKKRLLEHYERSRAH
jgi:radical SAM superfamily enzyme YgiQ (UPF0313 family)